MNVFASKTRMHAILCSYFNEPGPVMLPSSQPDFRAIPPASPRRDKPLYVLYPMKSLALLP